MKTKKVVGRGGWIVEVDLSDPRPALGRAQVKQSKALQCQDLSFPATFVASAPAEGVARSYSFSVLNETRIPRSDPFTGERYYLTIRCNPKAGHLERMSSGAIRDDHAGPQVGSTQGGHWVPDPAHAGASTLWADGARFLSGPRAQEIEAGIQPQGDEPPILQNVSVRVAPIRITEIAPTGDSLAEVIFEEWEYVHVAFTPDPAIATVGPGLSRDDESGSEAPGGDLESSTRGKEQIMKKKWVRDDQGNPIQVDLSDERPAVRLQVLEGDPPEGEEDLGRGGRGRPGARPRGYTDEERAEIEQLCDESGLYETADGRKTVREWMTQNLSADAVARKILERERTRAIAQPAPERLIDLSSKDAGRYRLANAVLLSLGKGDPKGLEMAVHQELKRQYPGANPNGGILVPTRLKPENLSATEATTPGKGAELVQSGPIDFMDFMRVAPVCRRMGAQLIDATAGSMPFVRRTGGATAYFSATGTKRTASGKKFQIQEATPHRAVAVNDYSLEWVRTASRQVDAMMLKDAVDAHAPLWDWSALYGPGGADPLGLFNLSGVNEVDFGNKVPTSAKLRECPRKVSDHEALVGSLGFIANGYLTDVLAETLRTTGALDYILKDGASGEADEYRFGNYRWRSSNQLGTTGSDYDGVFGAWQQLVFVAFGALEVITNPYEKDTEGIVKVTVANFYDTICRMAEAFSKFKGARLT